MLPKDQYVARKSITVKFKIDNHNRNGYVIFKFQVWPKEKKNVDLMTFGNLNRIICRARADDQSNYVRIGPFKFLNRNPLRTKCDLIRRRLRL